MQHRASRSASTRALGLLPLLTILLATQPAWGGPVGDGAKPAAAAPIPWQKLAAGGVLGSLGVPLGRVVQVKGRILPDDARRRKADAGATLLEVRSVEGQALVQPVVLTVRQLSWTSPVRFEPGQQVQLVGYESGAFGGIPEEAFRHLPRGTTAAFGFELWFQLVKVR